MRLLFFIFPSPDLLVFKLVLSLASLFGLNRKYVSEIRLVPYLCLLQLRNFSRHVPILTYH